MPLFLVIAMNVELMADQLEGLFLLCYAKDVTSTNSET